MAGDESVRVGSGGATSSCVVRLRRSAVCALAVTTVLLTGTGATAAAGATGATGAAPSTGTVAAELAGSLQPRPTRVPAPSAAALRAADVVPGVLLVTTTGQRATDRVVAAGDRAGEGEQLAGRVVRVDVPPAAGESVAAALAAEPGALAVEPAHRLTSLAAPDDRLYDRQWAHQLTGIERAWDAGTGSRDVVVAVLDDGVDARHPDLVRRVVQQRRFVRGAGTVRPTGSDNRQCSSSHGTHVAGVVGAQGNDGFGVSGVLWDVALLDYAVFTGDSRGGCGADEADVIAAMHAAAGAGADVMNLSLGSRSARCSTAFQTAVDAVRAAGVVVVAAAGNSGRDGTATATVPASCNGVISVAAVTSDGQRAPYSTANPYVDLAAPGGDNRDRLSSGVLSTVGDGRHDWLEGTSMAAPYVAGLAGLLRSLDPGLTPDQVEGLLESGAETGDGRSTQHGWGVLDAGRSVDLLLAGARREPAADPPFPVGGVGGDLLPPPVQGPQVLRVSAGTGRTEPVTQAVAVSRTAFADGAAEHAVLARRDQFPDALAGGSLTLGLGPLLYTGPTGPLPAGTRAELVRTLPRGANVYLLGGTAALPAGLEAELASLGLRPHRLSGADRESTAVAVARELVVRRKVAGFPDNGVVVLATSANWPDAVAAGSVGAYYGLPILLTPGRTLHPATAQALRELRPEGLLVLGGSTAISASTYEAATAAARPQRGGVRLAGGDRFATAVEIAGFFEDSLAAEGVSPRCVIAANVVRPDGWSHVLSASPLAGAYGCVPVPVQDPAAQRLPSATRAYVEGLRVDAVLAGDRDVISAAAATELSALLAR